MGQGRLWLAMLLLLGLAGGGVLLKLAEPTSASGASEDASAPTAMPASPPTAQDASPAPGASPTPAARGPLRVVGLGDSVESGFACGCAKAFVGTVADRLGADQHRAAVVSNLAVPGAQTGDVLDQLGQTAVEDQIRIADVVILEIGANDFSESSAFEAKCLSTDCFGSSVAGVDSNITRIVSRVQSMMKVPGSRLVLMGYWNVFKDGAVGRSNGATYVQVSDRLTRRLNALLESLAARVHAVYADAYSPFQADDDTDDLAGDGDHPNAAGHQLLANAVLEALGPAAATV